MKIKFLSNSGNYYFIINFLKLKEMEYGDIETIEFVNSETGKISNPEEKLGFSRDLTIVTYIAWIAELEGIPCQNIVLKLPDRDITYNDE